MITVQSNPAVTAALGTAFSTVAFTTDATPAVSTTASSAANGNGLTLGSGTGIVGGDFLAVETGAFDGVSPYISTVNSVSGTNAVVVFPSVRSAVSGAVCNRMERIETRYKAKKLVLTNVTNGDTHTWQVGMALGSATKVAGSGGAITTVSTNTFSNRSDCVAIHPNLLPVSSSFTLRIEYDFYVNTP